MVTINSTVPGTQGLASETYGNYIELEDAKQFLQIPDIDTARDFALQWCIGAACTAVQKFANRPLGKTLYEPPAWGVFNGGAGNTSSYIILPKQPVLQVNFVIEYQGSASVQLAEVTPGSGADGYRVNYPEGYIERILGGVWQRPWYPSEMGVLVSWWAGMSPVPDDIWFGTMMWVKKLFESTQIGLGGGRSPMAGHSESSGDQWHIPGPLRGLMAPWVQPSVG